MATGDFTIFEEFADQLGMELHDFDNDTLKLGLIDNVVTPTAADATPRWGAGSGVGRTFTMAIPRARARHGQPLCLEDRRLEDRRRGRLP